MMLPYSIMFVVHEALGISDAALGGDRRDAEYNLWMMLALLLGSLCFLVHTFVLPLVKGGGWGWVAPKILFLGACWGALVLSWNLRGPSFERSLGPTSIQSNSSLIDESLSKAASEVDVWQPAIRAGSALRRSSGGDFRAVCFVGDAPRDRVRARINGML